MRILQISSAQTLGGGERHLADLSNGLVRAGHEVFVCLRPGAQLASELKQIKAENFTKLPLRNSLDVASARRLAKLVRRQNIQIVHAHMARDYPLAAYAARVNPGSKLIVTRHVLFPLSRLHWLTLSRAAGVIAVSQAVRGQLIADRMATPERISVVLNGIDVAKFIRAKERFDRQQFFQKWGLPINSALVGTVGELSPLKGQLELLRVAAEVVEEIPNSFFIVAGVDHSRDGKNRRSIEEAIVQLNLSDRVKLVGWVEDLDQLYCALDVFVSASHTESFGLVIAEAMASETAVIATETEGAREIIEPGVTGLLVPIGDVQTMRDNVIGLLRDTERKAKLSMVGQQAATARFGLERMIQATEKIYTDVLSG